MKVIHFDLSDYADLLTPSEVAGLFRVDPKTVTRWVTAGKLTEACRTLGGHRRFSKDEVSALLNGEPVPHRA